MHETRKFLILGMACLGLAALAKGQPPDYPAARDEVQSDIHQAVSELNDVRNRISASRRGELAGLRALEEEVLELRRERERMQRYRDEEERRVRAMRNRSEMLEEEVGNKKLAMLEYRRGLESRIGVIDSQVLAPELEKIDLLLNDATSAREVLRGGEELMALAENLHESRLDVLRVRGSALDDAGRLHDGTFLAWGPVAVFQSDESIPRGLVTLRDESALAAVYTRLGAADQESIAGLIAGRDELLSVDVTHGRALRIRQARRTPAEFLRAGGFTMIPLLFIGAVSLLIAATRAISLYTASVGDSKRTGQVVEFLRAGEVDEARQFAAALRRPLRDMVDPIIEHARVSREMLEELAHEKILTIVPGMEKHLGTLAVFGGVAPLLGLLGTVTGMIHTFQRVTVFGTGDARQLSGGISEALITTLTGLAIAIPVLLVHAWLSRRVRALVVSLEDTAVEIIHELKS